MTTHLKKYGLWLFIAFTSWSCSLDIPLEDQVSDPDAVTTVTAAEKLLASAYKSYNSYLNTLDFALLSDDFQPSPLLKQDVSLKWIYGWNELGIVPLAKNEWESNYTTIMNCNALLERLPNIKTTNNLETKQLQQIKNRTLRLKAFCYFRLLKIFSPALKGIDANKELGFIIKDNVKLTDAKRISINESITYIENILKQTKGTGLDASVNWMSANSAQYLKAELALWQGNYQKVIEIAQPLYDGFQSDVFLEAQLSNLWSNNLSNARIFARNIADVTGAYFYNNIQYSKEMGDYAVVNSKIDFTANDTRKSKYLIPSEMMVSGSSSPKKINLFGKYNKLNREKNKMSYVNTYRAEGIVFLLAEAYTRIGNNTKSIEILNAFLTARKATLINKNISKEKLLTTILHEKQKEFVGEGNRFFDLKRNQQQVQRYIVFDKKLPQAIEIDDYRWVFPIPTSEIKYNKKCQQNKGWQHIK